MPKRSEQLRETSSSQVFASQLSLQLGNPPLQFLPPLPFLLLCFHGMLLNFFPLPTFLLQSFSESLRFSPFLVRPFSAFPSTAKSPCPLYQTSEPFAPEPKSSLAGNNFCSVNGLAEKSAVVQQCEWHWDFQPSDLLICPASTMYRRNLSSSLPRLQR